MLARLSRLADRGDDLPQFFGSGLLVLGGVFALSLGKNLVVNADGDLAVRGIRELREDRTRSVDHLLLRLVLLAFRGFILVAFLALHHVLDILERDGFALRLAADLPVEEVGNLGIVTNYDQDGRDMLLVRGRLLDVPEPLQPLPGDLLEGTSALP